MPSGSCAAVLPHQRMHDGLQRLQALRVVENGRAKLRPVDDALHDGAGKGFFDRLCGPAPVEPVHGRIGIVNGDAEPAEKIGGGRFAHADGTGEPEHEGHREPSISARINARSSGVTYGVTPNQRRKPGTA